MKYNNTYIKLLFCFFISNNLLAQNGSMLFLKQHIKWYQSQKQIASTIICDTITIYKNKKINDLEKEIVLVCQEDKRLKLEQDAKLSFNKTQNELIINADFKHLIEKNYEAKSNKIHKSKNSSSLAINLKDNVPQVIDYELDSFLIKMKLTVNTAKCFNHKQGAIVTIYYRGEREHLDVDNRQASSAKYYDWGHAFIGIKDMTSNKLYFLDGWPESSFNGEGQVFKWNENVDKKRCEDHHSISFQIEKKALLNAIEFMDKIKKSPINYKLIDFNCTDATTLVLDKLGIYTQKEHSGTSLPDSFANKLMEKLNELKICYEFDAFRIL